MAAENGAEEALTANGEDEAERMKMRPVEIDAVSGTLFGFRDSSPMQLNDQVKVKHRRPRGKCPGGRVKNTHRKPLCCKDNFQV